MKRPDPAAGQILAVLIEAQDSYRKSLHGWGALVSPPIPESMLARVAEGLAPVLRGMVEAAVAEQARVTT